MDTWQPPIEIDPAVAADFYKFEKVDGIDSVIEDACRCINGIVSNQNDRLEYPERLGISVESQEAFEADRKKLKRLRASLSGLSDELATALLFGGTGGRDVSIQALTNYLEMIPSRIVDVGDHVVGDCAFGSLVEDATRIMMVMRASFRQWTSYNFTAKDADVELMENLCRKVGYVASAGTIRRNLKRLR